MFNMFTKMNSVNFVGALLYELPQLVFESTMYLTVEIMSRVSEIQKWCGCPWATRISNFTCPPKQTLVAHHQQIFDEQQQQIIWSVCPVDN
jgi:hypothetical protein